jgi:hypothetical protein
MLEQRTRERTAPPASHPPPAVLRTADGPPHRSQPLQKDAERKFPINVDVPVPPGGLGRHLTDMLDWCHANVAAGAWAQHGHQERRKGERPADYARFYFATDADAAGFRRRGDPLTRR